MSLFIASLNSGSNGNCYYVGNEEEAVLIDVGISCREIEKRMKRMGLCMKKIKAIFISHEHGDHISGVAFLAKKYQLPVYITAGTKSKSRLLLQPHLNVSFKAYTPVAVGKLTVTAFPKLHDAFDPHSFIIASETVNVGVFTDIGATCEHVINNFKQCHAVFLEANYDEEMLMNGKYPPHLKQRIKGGLGHLSNAQAVQLFTTHRPPYMSHVLLSHISNNNNTPALALAAFSHYTTHTNIFVAPRHEETPVYCIKSTITEETFGIANNKLTQLQLSLF